MIKIMMHGCNGKMGRMITEIVKNDENAVITAGVDTYTETPNDYPVFDSVEKCTEDADVVIDFSNAGAVDSLLDYCVDKKLPVVLCTTGLSEEQLAIAEKAAEKTAVLKSAKSSWVVVTTVCLTSSSLTWGMYLTTRGISSPA